MNLLTIALVCASIQVVAIVVAGLRSRHVLNFAHQPKATLSTYPTASIVVPACNEQETIGPALRKLSAIEYPHLEIIVVNDRSSDQTGPMIDEAAAQDPRIKAVHNNDLPSGWLGKVHALHLGQQASVSDWILFTDADVHFNPDALEQTIAFCEQEGIDHLAVCPDLSGRSEFANSLIAHFHMILMFLVSPRAVKDPKKPDGVGVGAFNLVRRQTLEASQGFEWLRLEVADDFALGTVLKAAGGRGKIMHGPQLAQVEWYPSIAAMIHGFEKNAYSVLGHYSPLKAIAKLIGGSLPIILPIAMLPWTFDHLLGWVAVGAPLIVYWTVGWSLAQRIGWPYHRFLIAPFTSPLLAIALVNGLVKSLQRGGIEWRGTTYSNAELRAAQRIKL